MTPARIAPYGVPTLDAFDDLEPSSPGTHAVGGAHEGRRGGDFVRSLDRGLAVMRAFGPDRERLTLSDVARETGLTRSAARRFLLTLVELGYVRCDGRDFSLRPRVLELGYAYLSGMTVTEVAGPHVEDLVSKVQESCTIGVLDEEDVVCVLRVVARRIMVVAIPVGTRLPAYHTSMGRVLLAGLPPDEFESYLAGMTFEARTSRTVADREHLRSIIEEVRTNGFASVDQELEDGLRTIAVPIRDPDGAVAAGMAIPTHAARESMESLRERILPFLRATARQIEIDLAAQRGRRPLAPRGRSV